MVIGSSSERSLVRDCCRRLDPQYQQVNSPSESIAIENVLQKSTEKVETESVKVSVIASGISWSWTVTFCMVIMVDLSRLTWSSRCCAWFINSDGSINGLKSHGNNNGSGLILMLGSDLSVWLNSLRVQPGFMWILDVVLILTGWCDPFLQVTWAVWGLGDTTKWSVAEIWNTVSLSNFLCISQFSLTPLSDWR